MSRRASAGEVRVMREETIHKRGPSGGRLGARWLGWTRLLALTGLVGVLALAAPSANARTLSPAADTSTTSISTTNFVNQFDAEPYVGNGYFSQRIPAAGMGLLTGAGDDRLAARHAALHRGARRRHCTPRPTPRWLLPGRDQAGDRPDPDVVDADLRDAVRRNLLARDRHGVTDQRLQPDGGPADGDRHDIRTWTSPRGRKASFSTACSPTWRASTWRSSRCR